MLPHLLLAMFSLGQAPVDYVRDIKPILAEKCRSCHGALQQKGELRLDTVHAMLEGGNHGPSIERGKSETSLIVDHLLGRNGKQRMPPPKDGEALSAQQIAKLKLWIDAGAPGPADEQPENDPRDHWAFRTPVRPDAPKTNKPAANLIDEFISREWQKRNLKPQPPTERRLLLRRVYLDLIGLPPTRAEQEAFLADSSSDAYERVVQKLLQSPQYGERWGRHWMDIWRYSDPWGLGAEIRNSQKHIWHWRDWIVESLNTDTGYDQMVREMLAADELYPNDLQKLRATGYLVRPYFKFNRHTWLDETIEHTSKAFLGLTLNCVKCHDHKYDPFTHADYYRFRAFFEPYQIRTEQMAGESDVDKNGVPRAFDCNLDAPTYVHVRGDDRNPVKEKPVTPGLPKLLLWGPLDIQPVNLPLEASEPGLRPHVLENLLKAAQARIDAARNAVAKADADAKKNQESELLELNLRLAAATLKSAAAEPESIRARFNAERARATKSADARERAKEAALAEKRAALLLAEEAVLRAELELVKASKVAEAEKKRAAANASLEAAKKAVANPGEAFTPIRGAIKTLETNAESEASRRRPFPATSTGRRTALARWITDRKNPLTARVAVNHLWARHFGVPLVATVFDFGRKAGAPTHPELLDWLAVEFMDHGWSMKHIHRLIVTSRAYQLSSSAAGADAATLKTDPENRYIWRREPIRMESQLVRDSLLHLGGHLDLKLGGPPLPIADVMARRRSLYFVHSNNDNQKFLALFDDASVRECYRRSESIVPQQALALANSKLSLTMASKITDHLQASLASATDIEFAKAAFELVLGTSPTPDEIQACEAALREWRDLAKARPDAARRARGNLVHSILNHNDFVTIR